MNLSELAYQNEKKLNTEICTHSSEYLTWAMLHLQGVQVLSEKSKIGDLRGFSWHRLIVVGFF